MVYLSFHSFGCLLNRWCFRLAPATLQVPPCSVSRCQPCVWIWLGNHLLSNWHLPTSFFSHTNFQVSNPYLPVTFLEIVFVLLDSYFFFFLFLAKMFFSFLSYDIFRIVYFLLRMTYFFCFRLVLLLFEFLILLFPSCKNWVGSENCWFLFLFIFNLNCTFKIKKITKQKFQILLKNPYFSCFFFFLFFAK